MDIYYDDNYGKMYENIEHGTAKVFDFKCQYGFIRHSFIKRKIDIDLGDNIEYFDLVTPYGYGGPCIINVENSERKKLCAEFCKAFTNYCKKKLIVSEFIRFHPVLRNATDFEEMYFPKCIRETLGTNLRDYDDPVKEEFSKSCRKNIRRALKAGISYRITEAPDSIDVFKDIYYSTMNRDQADSFYYFPQNYFDNIIRYFKNNTVFVEAIYNDKTIAAGLYFISDGIIHIHLSGTLSEYLYLSPAYILRYAITLWGKEHGYVLIHHGGGTSNSADNSLYLFKKQFAKNTRFQFFVGKKIWNPIIYDKLCYKLKIDQNKTEFFPAYRQRG